MPPAARGSRKMPEKASISISSKSHEYGCTGPTRVLTSDPENMAQALDDAEEAVISLGRLERRLRHLQNLMVDMRSQRVSQNVEKTTNQQSHHSREGPHVCLRRLGDRKKSPF